MDNILTAEEMNLMCIFDTGSRAALIGDLESGLRDVYEPEMAEIFESTLGKLRSMTDVEYSNINLYIADEFTDGEDFEFGDD
jgi:hypothetical protein